MKQLIRGILLCLLLLQTASIISCGNKDDDNNNRDDIYRRDRLYRDDRLGGSSTSIRRRCERDYVTRAEVDRCVREYSLDDDYLYDDYGDDYYLGGGNSRVCDQYSLYGLQAYQQCCAQYGCY